MTIESFIEGPDGTRQITQMFHQPGSGHLYTSYPNGPGNFEALVVECTGENSANVFEIKDGSALQLGFDAAELPGGTGVTAVDAANPYERIITSPGGFQGKLIVRCMTE